MAEPDVEPCDYGTSNQLDDEGECVCRPDHTWCEPEDPESLDCCALGDGESGD